MERTNKLVDDTKTFRELNTHFKGTDGLKDEVVHELFKVLSPEFVEQKFIMIGHALQQEGLAFSPEKLFKVLASADDVKARFEQCKRENPHLKADDKRVMNNDIVFGEFMRMKPEDIADYIKTQKIGEAKRNKNNYAPETEEVEIDETLAQLRGKGGIHDLYDELLTCL